MKSVIIICFLARLCAGQFIYENVGKESTLEEINLDRVTRQAPHDPQVNYRPLAHAPANIKAILQSQQAREPLVNIPHQPPPQLAPNHAQEAPQPQVQHTVQPVQYRPQVQYASAPPPQPSYNNIKSQISHPQPLPQNQQQAYQGPAQFSPQPQHQQQQQPNYKAVYQPIQGPVQNEPQIQYSRQIPPHVQQIIQQHRP